MIHAYASELQYFDKILPVWNALPPQVRGEFTVHPRLDQVIPETGSIKYGRLPQTPGFLIVASQADSMVTQNPFIYVEHGAGQSYDRNKFYSNCERPNMLAALVPGPYCAEKTRTANPHAKVIEIGAPHLIGNVQAEPQSIVFAWHWRCSVAIEANTAFDEYRDVVPKVAAQWKVLGHGHPRIIGELMPYYMEHGIEYTLDPKVALARAAMVVCDNTSLAYEAAALNIPVVLLNKSEWNRQQEWGLRFWKALPGPMVDSPDDLIGVIQAQLDGGNSDHWTAARLAVTNLVYGSNPFGQLNHGVAELLNLLGSNAPGTNNHH